ncbi:MAG: thioredoxin domain-containing protein [Acidobacteria bacterium]|nr:thioredoxin domain-containing protein [Acidobacteriota bacterium]
MPNRLQHSLSPYLRQHAGNPVDWFPWGEEALGKARKERKPIFLSIGYSACHWCHVMERESFEDPDIAALLNEAFVPVKVDREERPDLDDLYMDAVQTLTGRGGWPMSVWLTPELEPFFGGTYFPPREARGMPGFLALLQRIAQLWAERREDLLEQASELTDALRRQTSLRPGPSLPKAEVFQKALADLRASFDPRWGGFGGAPKFPQQMAVELILRRGAPEDQAMVERTLMGMWEGGIFDHLGGGFSRYSVDHQWLIPHFEKMLYDNAQLAQVYLLAHQATGEPRYAAVARETLAYLLRDLRDGAGGFHSSEDADSEGVEGKFYVFTPIEVSKVLGEGDGAFFCEAFGITAEGNFEKGESVPQRFSRPLHRGEWTGRMDKLEELRRKMFQYRARRTRPGKDDKILAGWNGLALSALARGYQVLGDPQLLEAAEACASFLRRDLWDGRRLYRSWRGERAPIEGFLEDYAAVANGAVDLYEAGFDLGWLLWAEELSERMLATFQDPREGGFFIAPEGSGDLLFRQKPGFDNAIPSGNTLAAGSLLRLGAHLGREDFREAGTRVLTLFSELMGRAPRGFLGMLCVLDALHADPLEIVVAGDPREAAARELLQEVHRHCLPNRILVAGNAAGHPLLEGRAPGSGGAVAYLCRGRVCEAPVGSPADLRARLSSLVPGEGRKIIP